MDWLITLATGLAILVLFAPLLALLVTLFVLVPLAHLHAAPPMVSRASFACPVSHRNVHATFLTVPGFAHPCDVLACSVFGDGDVACRKGCLPLAEAHEAPSFMLARYALLADDEALRAPAPRTGPPGSERAVAA